MEVNVNGKYKNDHNKRVPAHRGQHMHSLHGPVFQTDHSGGHIQSYDVRTTLRLGA